MQLENFDLLTALGVFLFFTAFYEIEIITRSIDDTHVS